MQSTASRQPASLARCAQKRTAKNRWTDQKMNAFIFWLSLGFSSARKLSLQLPSYRRRLFVFVFKPVRQDGCPEGPSGPFGAGLGARSAQHPPCQFLFYSNYVSFNTRKKGRRAFSRARLPLFCRYHQPRPPRPPPKPPKPPLPYWPPPQPLFIMPPRPPPPII